MTRADYRDPHSFDDLVREASMGDEPYAALLPWVVFAIIDRARVDGPFWAGIGALITVVTLLATSTRHRDSRSYNVILLGGIVVFGALTFAGALHRADTGFVAHNGRVLSAAGFALIAFGSLIFTPASSHYTRPHVRSSHRNDSAFRHLNVLITSIWGMCFAGIALAHFVASAIGTPEAVTIFNWIVPLAFGAIAAHRTRICWDDFSDDDDFEPDPIRDLALDWQPPAAQSRDH
jgi:hypothetical protein